MAEGTLTLDALHELQEEIAELTGDDPREVVIDDDPALPSGHGWIYGDRMMLTPDVWEALEGMATHPDVSGPDTLMGIPVVRERGAVLEALRQELWARFDPVPEYEPGPHREEP